MRSKALRRTVAVTSGVLLAATMAVPVSATKDSDTDVAQLTGALLAAKDSAKITGISNDAPKTITAFVEVSTPTVIEATKSGKSVAQAEAAVKSHADTVAKSIADPQATVLYTTENAVSGFVVEGDSAAIAKLAERDDVLSVRRMNEHTINNANSVSLTRAVEAWQHAGNTGKDVNVAIIDSGVDFTHTTFGGAGDYTPYASNAARQADVTWPQGKVIGGWDYVGEEYYGDGKAAPDPNPIDVPPEFCYAPDGIDRSGGHGTHVAATAAGYGVKADGSQFDGDYATLTNDDLQEMVVGPGSAPEANIIAMKVFGCAGSTAYVMDALDDLLAKDADGSYKWDVDVVNLSLGSTYGSSADPENLVIDKLFEERGIISVIAAGNSGDFTVIGGSPGNAAASLTVANSINGMSYLDVAQITGFDDGAVGQYSVNYAWENAEVGPLEVVHLMDTGCEPLTADQAALVNGKAAYIQWNSDNLVCGSAQRFDNIEAAGGAGVVIPHQSDSFDAGIAGNEGIPGFQLFEQGTKQLDAALASGTVEITYQKAGIFAKQSRDDSAVDTLNNSSSRGEHGSFGLVKPDVAAPGTNIMSAGVGTGNGAVAMTGTSMATPHTAGIVALAKQAHPDWNAVQLKANVMNTAFHDVTDGSTVYGPQRTGAGRVDAYAAVHNNVVMYDSEATSLASVNFGIVEFPQDGYSASRKVTIENLGDQAANLNLGYRAATTVPGVSFDVSPNTVSVPAGAKSEVTVSVSIDASVYQRTIDPTMSLTHTALNSQFIRDFVTSASGRLFANGVGAPEGGELHLPVNVTPKPASALHGKVELNSELNGGDIAIEGETFEYQPPYPGEGQLPLVPVAMAFQHVADSPERVFTDNDGLDVEAALKATDIKTVGVNTSLENLKLANAEDPATARPLTEATVVVGVETWGPWSAMPIGSQTVDLHVKANGQLFDVVGIRVRGTDVPVYAVFDSENNVTGIDFPNAVPGALLDTNRMDTAVIAIPFSLDSVGITEEQIENGNVDLEINVVGYSWYAPSDKELGLDPQQTDRVGFTFNPTKAKFMFDNALGARNSGVHIDGETLPFVYHEQAPGAVVTQSLEDDKIMLMHFHNKVGDQVELLELTEEEEPVVPDPTDPPVTPDPTDPPVTPDPTEPGEPPITPDPTEPGEPPVTPDPTEPGEPPVTPDPTEPGKPPVTPEPTEPGKPPVTPEPTEPGKPPVTPEPTEPGKPPVTPEPTETGEPPKPYLPITGGNAVMPALFAAGLLGVGGVLVSRKYAR